MLDRVINSYKIVDFIGSGSFASVYKVELGNQFYAMKLFNYDYVFQEFKRHNEDNRISREIAILQKVNHKNVTQYVDKGSYEENGQTYLYLVMEFIEGTNLKKYLSNLDKPLSIEQTLNLFKQVLSGLNAVHSQNIVHRDLKPENIFITNSGTIKILDFGLSKLIDYTSITSTGSTVGSPLYMSPEQIKDSKSIDYRSDYYSLGVILFEMLTQNHPYGEIESVHQLYYKILNEPPSSALIYNYEIPNGLDNLINHLLRKSNYERPNSKEDIMIFLESEEVVLKASSKQMKSEFYLRVWNEKNVLNDYIKDDFTLPNCIFPINHQTQQKKLLDIIRNNTDFIIDPATTRLAYDSCLDVKGLAALPYAPKGFDRIEIRSFSEYETISKYVESVIEEQMKYDPSAIVAPFHVSNNTTNNVTFKNSGDTWFSLDVKFLKEAKDYLTNNKIDKNLIMGVCLKNELLSSKTEREYLINVLTSLPADSYWVYVDTINYDSGVAQIYNYVKTLLTIQNSTGKKVIAGRVGSIGLLLSAFGIAGFESGAARFESFSEDLFQPKEDSYNLYVNYYFPELIRSVAIYRKDPSRFVSIMNSSVKHQLICQCPYCKNKNVKDILLDANVKKHFLYQRKIEMDKLNSCMDKSDKLEHLYDRIDRAIALYQKLGPIFKPTQYQFLKNWKQVIDQFREDEEV